MRYNIINGGLLVICGLAFVLVVDCQQESQLASQALNRFALNLFTATVEELENVGSVNLALSPYTVWSLLAIIAEGAKENTAREMDRTLELPENKELFRKSYRALQGYFQEIGSSGVQLDLTSNVFATDRHPLKSTYKNLIRNIYNTDVLAVDFTNLGQAAKFINNIVAEATNYKIDKLVLPGDMQNAEIVLTSTLYFKGMWSIPFNKSVTSKQPFYNEGGNIIGEVDMMYQVAYYPYTIISELNAWAIELQYGEGNQVSMIVLLPRQGERLTNMLQKLKKSSIVEVIRKLDESAQMFEDENIQVYLPKFHVNSDLTLNAVLKNLGMIEVFDENKANLKEIYSESLYLTRVFQKADIAVDESGTVATSAAGGTVSYKAPPPKFNANKPFAYFIVDKKSGSIFFMGTVVDPHTI